MRPIKHLAARLLAALALAAGSIAPAGAGQQGQGQVVLAVFAHPDDELFVAPMLAALARNGAHVQLVYATSGDAGPGVSGMEKGAELAARREQEARCAADALGLPAPIFARLGDGTLGIEAHAQASPARRFTAFMRRTISSLAPSTIVTWGPDGGYGHADHRMVSAIVTEIVQREGAERPKLLYPGLARSDRVDAIAELSAWAQTDPELLDETYPYDRADLARAARAAECHVTQFDAATRAGLAALLDAAVWQGAVRLRKAL